MVLKHVAMALTALMLSGAAMAEESAKKDYVILEVGEHKIKYSQIENIWKGLFPGGQVPEFDSVEDPIKQNVLRGALSEFLLYDDALKGGLDKDPLVQEQIADAQRKIVVRSFINKKSEDLVSDEDVKKKYDEVVMQSRGKKEVRARHVLVEKEETAKDIAKKLKNGGKFEDLAKEYSKDPGSKVRGGDLGYFSEGTMVEAFEKAAFALKKGQISAPVKSDFGWHIIKLEDERDVKVPSFTDLKDSLRKQLAEQKLNAYVNNLIDQKEVIYYGPDGSKKELTKVPDQSKK